MRVALDGEPLLGARTGVGNFVLGLMQGLISMPSPDLEVTAYAVTWRMRPELEWRLPPGVRRVGRPMPARPVRMLWDHRLDAPLEWWTGPLDVVHGTNYIVPPTRRAARVVTVHDLTTVRYPEICEAPTLAFPGFVRRAVAGGAWVHTHSRFVADEVVAEFGADSARVRVVAPGIPEWDESGTDEDLSYEVPFGRYVLAVGTVEPRKDYPGLLRAFEDVAGERPDLGLVIAGRDGWGAGRFQEALAESSVRSRVRQLGYVSDRLLKRLLGQAAVLAYPSVYEGFGFPPLQAMAAGVPVVTTAAGSVPEVVGDAAVVVPAGDRDALAGALAGVLDDESKAKALSEAGRRRAGHYTWSGCAAGMTDLYSDASGA